MGTVCRIESLGSLANARAPLGNGTVAHHSAVRQVVQDVAARYPTILECQMHNITIPNARFRVELYNRGVGVYLSATLVTRLEACECAT
jgi:hypothetical protein